MSQTNESPAVTSTSLCGAAASGDVQVVRSSLENGGDPNVMSSEGFAPLCIAAFWGYADIVKLLLEHGADVNVTNKGTGWTACHCAAFQGHGKVLLYLTAHKPDITVKDSLGRTAADFASAMDSVWPFFAAMGCQRTPKADLIHMEIMKKTEPQDSASVAAGGAPGIVKPSHFTRPGSSYVVLGQTLEKQKTQSSAAALAFGDVLREDTEEQHSHREMRSAAHLQQKTSSEKTQLNMWRS